MFSKRMSFSIYAIQSQYNILNHLLIHLFRFHKYKKEKIKKSKKVTIFAILYHFYIASTFFVFEIKLTECSNKYK